MISRTACDWHIPDWRREMAQAVTDPEELLRLLDLPPDLLAGAQSASRPFSLRVPRGFLALMERGNPRDPLLLQVLPQAVELLDVSGFGDDPVGDQAAAQAPGVLSKYQGRALLIASPACALHCRYCFRRAFPYAGHQAARGRWRGALELLARTSETREVILSGGDPLALDDQRLAELLAGLEAIPHLRRLRIHTRLPVVIPARITADLLDLLKRCRLTPVLVLHFNHPRELAPAIRAALGPLRGRTTLLNQSVLLRGVNDDPAVLAELSERLFDSGILPYYIHLLDRVRGAAHFEVNQEVARSLMTELRARLPGYLVPRLVREERGATAKTPIA
jgi:L-lysine 2,3-aminomutase